MNIKCIMEKINYKTPIILQMGSYDCGPTALMIILSYYGCKINFSKLKDKFTGIGDSRDGTSMLKIKQVAEAYNMKCYAKKMPCEYFQNDILPAILFWNNNHYVILEKVKKSTYIINDPSAGRYEISEEEFKKRYSNISLFMYPNENFKPCIEEKYSKIQYFKELIVSNKNYFILLMCTALLLQFIALIVPILIENLIDVVVGKKIYDNLLLLFILIMVVSIIQVLTIYFKSFCILKLQKSLDKDLNNKFISHMLKLPYKYFETRSKGDLMLRINSNTQVRQMLSEYFISSLINIFLVIIVFAYIFSKSKSIALVLLLFGFIQIIVFLLSKDKSKILSQKNINTQSLTASFITEVLEGISTVKSLAIEEPMNEKWKDFFNNQLDATEKRFKFQINIDMINNIIKIICPLIVLFISINELINGNSTVGSVFAFQALSSSFLQPINQLTGMLNEFVTIENLLDRIYDVMNTKEERLGEIEEAKINGDITIKNVYFKYSEWGEYCLKDINLNIKAGQKVALVGKTGSGKSTLAKLLVGLYAPTEGKIYFDEYESNSLNKRFLRKNIGIVLQDNFLFNRSIYDNIKIHCDEVSKENVMNAARVASISEDIENMPMRYETVISESGSNISGGQKQRIAVARAVVNNPKILLLDEATSALDNLTERKIEENLRDLKCTQIIIAHRLSTIVNADVIFVIDNGRIVESGKHDHLVKYGTLYKELYNSLKEADEKSDISSDS